MLSFYKTTNYNNPECEGSILWSDKDIGIHWPKEDNVIMSEKDKNAPLMGFLIKSKII